MAHFGPALFATTLIPLYRVLHQIPTTMVGMGDHVTFHLLVSKLSPSLTLTQDLTHPPVALQRCETYTGGQHQRAELGGHSQVVLEVQKSMGGYTRSFFPHQDFEFRVA